MKILQLIPNLSSGGAERFVVDLCNSLSPGDTIILVTLYDNHEGDVFRNDLIPSVITYSLGKKVGFDYKMFFRLFKLIGKTKPDVIHTHLGSLNYLLVIAPFLKKYPVIHTVHNDALKESPNAMIRRIRNYFFKSGRVIPVTISDESANSFEKVYADINYFKIYNGRKFPFKSSVYENVIQELQGYKIDPKTKIYVHIGSVKPQKNQLMLVKAFTRYLKQTGDSAVLLIIGGKGSMKESNAIQVNLEKAQKDNPHIYFVGPKFNATDYLYASDFLCLPSVFEGMPITLIEALAIGTIPICTPVGGMIEMVSALDPNLLSKSLDVDDYADALNYASGLSSVTINKLKNKQMLLFKEKYSIEKCKERYETLYKSLLL